jgi:hypothetical protein
LADEHGLGLVTLLVVRHCYRAMLDVWAAVLLTEVAAGLGPSLQSYHARVRDYH